MIALSYSRANLYTHCKAAFKWRHIDKVDEVRSDALEGGSIFHEWAEQYHKHLITTGRQTDLEELRKIAGQVSGDVPYEVYEDIRDLFLEWGESFIYDPGSRSSAELNLAFTTDWKVVEWDSPDVFLRMKIDRVNYGDLTIITDYKTSRALPPKDPLQLKTYAFGMNLASRDANGLATNGVYLVRQDYVRLGIVLEKMLTFDDYKDVGDYYLGLAEKIEANEDWEPTVSSWCTYCGFKPGCPKYEADVAGTDLDLQGPDQAQALAEKVFAMDQWAKAAKDLLKAWIEGHGDVAIGDQVFGPTFSDKLVLDIKVTIKNLQDRGVPDAVIWAELGMNKTGLKRTLKPLGLKGKAADEVVMEIAKTCGSVTPEQEYTFHKPKVEKKKPAGAVTNGQPAEDGGY